jgi:predicted tellurium resistance membrane protein TerC
MSFLIALVSLATMEIVLGIDNLVVLAIIVGRVPPDRREFVRRIGLGLALFARLGLLFTLSYLSGLTAPLFTILRKPFSGRDLVLFFGGLFLMAKSAHEIYEKVELHEEDAADAPTPMKSLAGVLAQIVVLDLVFSLDSVITAVGMAQDLRVMVLAMISAVTVMFFFAKAVGDFVEEHPSVKLLALSFLLLIGVLLVAESTGQHVSKGYVYFAMGFSFGVEMLSIRYSKRQARLRASRLPPPAELTRELRSEREDG